MAGSIHSTTAYLGTGSEVSPIPQITNSWLLSTAVAFWSATCTVRNARYCSREHKKEHRSRLGCCQSDDSRTGMEMHGKTSSQTLNHDIYLNDRHVFPAALTQSAAQLIILEYAPNTYCGSHSPSKGIQLAYTTNTSDVNNTYQVHATASRNKTETNDDCCSREGVRAGRGSSLAVLLTFSKAASTP